MSRHAYGSSGQVHRFPVAFPFASSASIGSPLWQRTNRDYRGGTEVGLRLGYVRPQGGSR